MNRRDEDAVLDLLEGVRRKKRVEALNRLFAAFLTGVVVILWLL